jgi:hypothetical protein
MTLSARSMLSLIICCTAGDGRVSRSELVSGWAKGETAANDALNELVFLGKIKISMGWVKRI